MDINILSLTGKNSETPRQEGQTSPARLLSQAGIESGETRLARVLATLENAGGRDGARLLLELNGQKLPVRSEQSLQPGTLIRIMRAANELRLMDLPEPPQRSVLTQALARKMPFQHNLAEGLNQLLNTASDSRTPQPIREAIQQLAQLIFQPRAPSTTSTSSVAGAATPQSPPTAQASPTAPTGGTNQPFSTQATGQAPLQGEVPTPERIRQWLSDSGVFREARLVTASTKPSGETSEIPRDLKNRLIHLALTAARHQAGARAPEQQVEQVLKRSAPSVSPNLVNSTHLQFPSPTPELVQVSTQSSAQGGTAARESLGVGEVLRLLAGMINRITVNQLHAQAVTNPATADAPGNQTWILELPWLTSSGEARLVQARLEQKEEPPEDAEQDEESSNQREWRLNLALDLDGIGPLYFDLTLKQRRLSTRIWAEKASTAKLVEETQQQLHTALSNLDLEVAPIECHQGQPVAIKTRLSQHLVDEHA